MAEGSTSDGMSDSLHSQSLGKVGAIGGAIRLDASIPLKMFDVNSSRHQTRLNKTEIAQQVCSLQEL